MRPKTSVLAAMAMTAALVLMSSCGEDSSPTADDTASDSSGSASGSPSDSGLPACSDVWVDGAKLPRGYHGCADGGDVVKANRFECSSGQWFVTYVDRYWAVIGGVISEGTSPLTSDPDYKRAIRSCSA